MIAKYGQSILPQLETVDMSAIIDEANASQTGRKKRYANEPTNNCGAPAEDSNCESQLK